MNALLLEIVVILFAIGLYLYMKKAGHEKVGIKFITLFVAVLLFEIMSEPMWINKNLDTWAYLFRNVAWIITLGWVNIFFISFLIVDGLYKKMAEKKKFWLYLLAVTIITVPIESLLLKFEFRDYAEVLKSTFSGLMIPLTQVPIEVLIAVPIIAALVIPFYKYIAE